MQLDMTWVSVSSWSSLRTSSNMPARLPRSQRPWIQRQEGSPKRHCHKAAAHQ